MEHPLPVLVVRRTIRSAIIPSTAIVAAIMINGALRLKRLESQTPPHIDKLARVLGGTVILFCSVKV
jgi:hypothetical protein